MAQEASSSLLAALEQCHHTLTAFEARQADESKRFWETHKADCDKLQTKQTAERHQQWANLQQAHTDLLKEANSRQSLLLQDRTSFAAEKAAMRMAGSLGEIVELNVGGVLMTTTRSTLTQVEDSMLAAMFSERWAGSHKLDENGRIFLNYNPYCFDKVLRHLRSKTLDHSYHPVCKPDIDTEHAADYFLLLGHLGLLGCMGYSVKDDMQFAAGISMKFSTDGRIAEAIVQAANCSENVCIAAPVMPVDQVHYFKCALLTDTWVFMGVNQASSLETNNREHATSYGWSTVSKYQGGKYSVHGLVPWQQGDAVVFKLDLVCNNISMCSRRHAAPWSMPIDRLGRTDPFVFLVSFNSAGQSPKDSKVQLLDILPSDFAMFEC